MTNPRSIALAMLGMVFVLFLAVPAVAWYAPDDDNQGWIVISRSEPVDTLPEIGTPEEVAVWELICHRYARRENDMGLMLRIYETMQIKAYKYGLRLALVGSVVNHESGFNPWAVSSCGACGLMQLMPYHFKWLGITDPFDIEQNLDGGCKYLASLLEKYHGNETLALAHYNGGGGTARRSYEFWPAETKRYVPAVIATDRSLRRPRPGGKALLRRMTPAQTPEPNRLERYTVQRGDTLWRIAQRHGTTVGRLARDNGIENPDVIEIGQRLEVRG